MHATARCAHEIRSLAASQNFLRLRRADVQRLAATKFSPGGAREKKAASLLDKWQMAAPGQPGAAALGLGPLG